jgi:hypothetical protein
MAEDVLMLNIFMFTESPCSLTSRNKEQDITNPLFINDLPGQGLVYAFLELYHMDQLYALQDGKSTDVIKTVVVLWGILNYGSQHFINTN